ncbi:MAG: hypothetical protein JWL90_4228 [Chthoniobacteraceae bacterium]|nr:hypothetical protein [Chthoniobacteraceae bacterium]
MNKLLHCLATVLVLSVKLYAQAVSPGETEAQRCEEKIASVQRDVLGKYEDGLQELQNGFQKAADLDGALAVRAERQRVTTEGRLGDEHLVAEPKTLRALQVQNITRLKDLTAQLVQETVPKLLEFKKSLTIAGKLDEALAVRAAIERLQNGYVPLTRAEAGALVPGDTLLQAYAADKARADKAYKGQKIAVRGVFGGFRQDANDPKLYQVYLAGSNGGWVQCTFSLAEFRFREEKQFNNLVSVVVPKGDENAAVRFQKGQTVEIHGICEGFDEVVRLGKCDYAR